MLRSATLVIGLLLALIAFAGFLFLGGMMAPPPYQVVIALQDIPANTAIEASMLGSDSQRVNAKVVRTLVQASEVDAYLSGLAVENIAAGEPLRKSAIAADGNPAGASRFALLISDPTRVAMVVPVDAKSSPSAIAPGDRVDLVISFGAANLSGSNPGFGTLLAGPTPSIPAFGSTLGSLPGTITRTVPGGPVAIPTSAASSGYVPAEDMNNPSSKIVIQAVPVLAIQYGDNPNATMNAGTGFGGTAPQGGVDIAANSSAPIVGLTVAVPRASAELVAFGVDNGKLHISVLSPKLGANGEPTQSSTLGVTWNDLMAWMIHERHQATGDASAIPAMPVATPVPGAVQPTPGNPNAPAAPVSPTLAPSPTPPARIAPSSSAGDVGLIFIPLSCGGVLLVLAFVAVRFIRGRRKQSDLV